MARSSSLPCLGYCQNIELQDVDLYTALANDKRLAILEWLKDPRAHFPPQVDGDLVEDRVCALLIAGKLGISPATLSEHMRVLGQAGLVEPGKVRQWKFYRRKHARIAAARADMFPRL